MDEVPLITKGHDNRWPFVGQSDLEQPKGYKNTWWEIPVAFLLSLVIMVVTWRWQGLILLAGFSLGVGLLLWVKSRLFHILTWIGTFLGVGILILVMFQHRV
ncbi:MAG: hypothetical protein ABIP74_04310 [Candidatus Saccharimonas sp.]